MKKAELVKEGACPSCGLWRATEWVLFPQFTLPETNIFAPENRPSQKETSIPTIHFQGLS